MGRNIIAAAALSAALSFNSPVAAQPKDEVLTLSPSGPWNVDFAEDFCALRRNFKAGDDLATLELRQYVPGYGFDLLFLAQGIDEPKDKISYRFLPHEDLLEPIIGNAIRSGENAQGIWITGKFGPASKDDEMSVVLSLPETPDDQIDSWAAAVSKLRFESGFARKIDVETGPLNEAMAIMQTCLSGLIESWGINLESRATALQGVRPKNQKSWARKTLESFPTEALRRGIRGSVRVRVVVGADGKPKSCLSLGNLSAEILQRAACDAMMKYSRFEPALDKDGEPMVSYFLTSITYSSN